MQTSWQSMSGEIFAQIQAWRQTHPQATLRDIEQIVREQLSRLEAQLIQDTAQASEEEDWAK